MKTSESIVIVDDDSQVWKTWAEALEEQGYNTAHASSMVDAERLFEKNDFGLALVNMISNGCVHGIDVVEWIRENNPNMDVIVVATAATLDASIDCASKRRL